MTEFFRIKSIPNLPGPDTPSECIKGLYLKFQVCLLESAPKLASDYRPELLAIAKFIDYLDGSELFEAVSIKIKLLRNPASLPIEQMERFGEIALALATKLYPNDLQMRRTQEGIFWDRFSQAEVNRFNARNESKDPTLQQLVLKRLQGRISPEERTALERSIIERS